MSFWVTKSEHVENRYFIFADDGNVVTERQVDIKNSLITSKHYLTSQEKTWFRDNVLKTVKNRYHLNQREYVELKKAI